MSLSYDNISGKNQTDNMDDKFKCHYHMTSLGLGGLHQIENPDDNFKCHYHMTTLGGYIRLTIWMITSNVTIIRQH
jgi:hypothetical protein